jgi:hypothetical protein
MQTTLSTLQQVATMQTINEFAAAMTNQIKSGLVDPIEALAQMKILTEAFEKVKDECKDLMIKKVYDLGADNKTKGFKFEVVESGIKYDYRECNCSEWTALDAQEKAVKEEKKGLEKELKSIHGGKMIVSEDTGEIWNSPIKSAVTTIKMTKLK